MVSWLLIIILAYFFFSLSALGDKIVLDGPQKPISYTFYVAFSGILVAAAIPFVGFNITSYNSLFWVAAEAIVFILGIYTAYIAVEKFDLSKVATTIGAIQPLFVFALTYLVWGAVITNKNILAFALLLTGSIMISFENGKKHNLSYLALTTFAALLFALDYIFSKMIFLSESFLDGFIQTRIAIFILALLLLLSAKNRRDIFSKKIIRDGKRNIVLIGSQVSGGVASFLQYFAISLSPIALLPILNSTRGIQYIFIFILTIIASLLFPKMLKEKLSKRIIIKKIGSIILIVGGLALLVL